MLEMAFVLKQCLNKKLKVRILKDFVLVFYSLHISKSKRVSYLIKNLNTIRASTRIIYSQSLQVNKF